MNKIKAWFNKAWLKAKKAFKYAITSIAIFFGANIALAQEVELLWTAPIEYTDNSPILAVDSISYNVYCDAEAVVSVITLSYLTDRTPGTYTCYVTAVVNGVESDPSNTVTKIVEFPKPKAPVLQ